MKLSLQKLSSAIRPRLQLSGRSERRWRVTLLLAIGIAIVSVALSEGLTVPNLAPFTNDSGAASTFSRNGAIALSNPFFQSLGTNGRSCASCHQIADGWSVTPAHVRARFDASGGLDPIFRPVDGADCPSADVSTVDARRDAYSMLLSKGLIRVSIGVPSGAEFSITNINDPHRCRDTAASALALFRRPLPASNLPFLTTVMWDGRETFSGQTLDFDLGHQATDATLGHAQASKPPTSEQVAQIVKFESSNFASQAWGTLAQDLAARGASGGSVALSSQPFHVGINDPLGGDPTGQPFNPVAFTLFDSWSGLNDPSDSATSARAAIARGEALFNSRRFTISGVTGLNDLPNVPAALAGTCTTCHDTPNVGNHSVPLAINIGVADYPARPGLDITGLPVYTVKCKAGTLTPIGEPSSFQTTDPARALLTGNCRDIGKTKGPVLRGLAARPPYFHNGSAATLRDVVDFYDQRFGINLTDQEKSDLVAFLQSL